MEMKAAYLDLTRISHDRLEVDRIYQRFSQCDVLDTRIVEPVDIVPDCSAQRSDMQSEDTSGN